MRNGRVVAATIVALVSIGFLGLMFGKPVGTLEPQIACTSESACENVTTPSPAKLACSSEASCDNVPLPVLKRLACANESACDRSSEAVAPAQIACSSDSVCD